jgi:Fe-S cluster assembly iron-binding protein IscA
MIEVTSRAKEELRKMLTTTVDMPQARLRLLSRSKGQLGLGVDIEYPGDLVVEHDGIEVLIVEHELAYRLDGVTLDIEDTPEGPELVVCASF